MQKSRRKFFLNIGVTGLGNNKFVASILMVRKITINIILKIEKEVV